MILETVKSTARTGALASIGAVALAGDVVSEAFDDAVRSGEHTLAELRVSLEQSRVYKTFESEGTALRERLGTPVSRVASELQHAQGRLMDNLDLPARTAIVRLDGEVARLSALVDEMRAGKAGAPKAVASRVRMAEPLPEPLPDYDTMNVDTVVSRLHKLGEAELLAVRAYEQQNSGRITVLRAVERTLANQASSTPQVKMTVEPFPRYTELGTDELRLRLVALRADQLRHALAYERDHLGRKETVALLEERLRTLQAQTS